MSLIELSVLIASRGTTFKGEIVREALRLAPVESPDLLGANRTVLAVVDKMVAAGFIRNESLGEYKLTDEGAKEIQDQVQVLQRVMDRARFGSFK